MAWSFRPPPGWVLPPGFTPPQGWTPEPGWPPATPGWQFWEWVERPGTDTASSSLPPPAPSHGVVPTPAQPVLESGAAVRPSFRERQVERANARQRAEHERLWREQQALADELALAARHAAEGMDNVSGVLTKKGEVALTALPADLVEPKVMPGHFTGGYSGVSFRIAKGVNYRIGGMRGHYTPGPEVQAPKDSGTAYVTTKRVVFTGSKSTREWAYAKLLSVAATADGRATLLHVSNRQKASGLSMRDAMTADRFEAYLALGLAIEDQGAAAVAALWSEASAASLAAGPGTPPEHGRYPWYLRTRWIAALLIFFAPLGILLTWTTSGWRRPVRIAATAASLILFITAITQHNTSAPNNANAGRASLLAPATTSHAAEPQGTPATHPVSKPATRTSATVTAARTTPRKITAAPPPATTHYVPPPAPHTSSAAPPPPPKNLCGAPQNPYGYNFCGGSTITNPESDVCNYFNCIASFWNGTGYMVECQDTTYSMSGGHSGACSHHSGELRPVYQ